MNSDVAPDGSPVEAYAQLPSEPDLTVIRGFAVGPRTVLDLGCGVGRIADLLAVEGHDVVAVDESSEMLRLVRHARPLQSKLEELDLGRQFDLVLLLSHLINAAGADAFVSAAARHLADDGLLVAQRLEPGRPWRLGRHQIGSVGIELTDVTRDGDRVLGATRYTVQGRSWLQRWELWERSDKQLQALLAKIGLRLSSADGTWITATR